MNVAFLKKPWLPMFVGFLLAASFVVFQPGSIAKDAGEYEALSQSILQGQFSIDGQASMLRELGYPVFRAAIHLVTSNQQAILWIQVLLFVSIIWLIWDSLRRFDSRLAMIGAWSAALSYGLAFYASRHLLEMFAAFLVALVVWFAVRAMSTEQTWKELIAFSFASCALILTRVSLALIPIGLLLMILVNLKKRGEWMKRGVVSVAIIALFITPWIVRNGKTFGVWSITGRTGIQVAARAYKSNESWGRLRDSLGSVVIGRSLLTVIAPQSKPIILEQWKWVWDRFAAWGVDRNEIEADKAIKKEAFEILLSDQAHFWRGGLWSIVDMGRLLALPSPLSPEFGIEGMFWPKVEAGTIGFADIAILVVAQLLQLGWWIGILAGLYFGFMQFGKRFFPGYIVIAVMIAHVPADNIVRYAAPIEPWLLFLTLWSLTKTKFGRKLATNLYGTRE